MDVELITATRYANEDPKKTVIIRDLAGNVLRTIDGENVDTASASSNFEYGPFNQLTRLSDNDDNVTAFDWDAYGRLRQHVDPDTGTTDYTYSGFNQVKTRKGPDQKLTVYSYDAVGRVKTLATGTDVASWTYDVGPGALGQVVSSTSPATAENPAGQQVAYGYDPGTGLPGSTTYTIDGQQYTIAFHYDSHLRLARIDYPVAASGAPVQASFDYDPASGALSQVREVGSGVQRPVWHLDSAYEGQLAQQVTFGNGAVSTYGYDADRRWLTSARTTLSSDVIQDLEYSRYGNGQVHERITPTRTREYTYDPLGRLASMVTSGIGAAREYRYDGAGNVTHRGSTVNVYQPNHPHLLEHVGSVVYGYEHGNVTSRVGPTVPGGSQTIEYTPFNLPHTIRTGTGGAERITTFDYTADAQRVVRRDAAGARHFVSNLYERLLSPSGATVEERFRIPGTDSTIAEIIRRPGSTDRTLYFHDDHQGTPETISDSDGEFTHQEYGPFGEPIGDPPEVNEDLTRRGYTGHSQDNDLGLIDMGGCIYDPLAGRFMSPDPIMQAPFSSQGHNRYSYVFNDPINRVDPSGFMSTGSVGGDVATVGVLGVGWGVVGYGIATELSQFGVAASAGALGSLAGAGAGIARSLALTKGSPGGGKAIVRSPLSASDAVQERRFDPGQYAADWFWEKKCSAQCEAVQAEMNKKIEVVEALEWELFWAYTGGKALRVGVAAFRAWRLNRAIVAVRNSTVVARTLGGTVGEPAGKAVTEVITGKAPLDSLTTQVRGRAAAFYRDVATRTGGSKAADASRYNIARAESLEGTRDVLSHSLPEFIKNGF